MINLKPDLLAQILFYTSSIIILFSIIIPPLLSQRIGNVDYIAYRAGAAMVLEGRGEDLYNIGSQIEYVREAQKEALGEQEYQKNINKYSILIFKNIPITTLVYMPLSYLNLAHGYTIFLITNFFLYLAIVHKVHVKIKEQHRALYYSSLILLLPTLVLALLNAQVSILILTLIYFILLKDNMAPFHKGLLMALLVLKPQALLILPLLLVGEKSLNKTLYGLVIGILTIHIANMLIVGPNYIQSLVALITSTATSQYGSHMDYMFTLYGVLVKIGMTTLYALLLNVLGYLLILGYVFFRRDTLHEKDIKTIAIISLPIFAIHMWHHDLVIFLLLIPLLVANQKFGKEYAQVLLLSGVTIISLAFGNIATVAVLLLSLLWYIAKTHSRSKIIKE